MPGACSGASARPAAGVRGLWSACAITDGLCARRTAARVRPDEDASESSRSWSARSPRRSSSTACAASTCDARPPSARAIAACAAPAAQLGALLPARAVDHRHRGAGDDRDVLGAGLRDRLTGGRAACRGCVRTSGGRVRARPPRADLALARPLLLDLQVDLLAEHGHARAAPRCRSRTFSPITAKTVTSISSPIMMLWFDFLVRTSIATPPSPSVRSLHHFARIDANRVDIR